MDPVEKGVREAHPDWNDEQVAAEVARIKAEPPAPPAPPAPTPPDNHAFAEMRRRAEAAEREAQALREAEAERARKQAEEEGRWKELAEQEKARADRLEADQRAAEQRRNAERAAGDLNFRDAGYALYLLEQDRVDFSDAAAVKTALEQKATSRPDLLAGGPPPPSGGPAGGGTPPPPKLTAEQIAAMSPSQIAKLDPKVVNDALAAG